MEREKRRDDYRSSRREKEIVDKGEEKKKIGKRREGEMKEEKREMSR